MRRVWTLAIMMASCLPAVADGMPDCMDYSYCGYHASADTLPVAQVKAYVELTAGADMQPAIQQAIDYVASLPQDKDGMRGVVLLGAGTYDLHQPVWINASGVVLRGAGRRATTLRKLGTDRGAMLHIEGRNDLRYEADTLWVNAPVTLGTLTLSLQPGSLSLQVGQEIEITRQSSWPWIERMGCRAFGGGLDALGWKPGDAELHWRRRVTSIDRADGSLQVTLDAPLTMAFDPTEEASFVDNKGRVHEGVKVSPCHVRVVHDFGQIRESGVECLTLQSAYNAANGHDENHCWTGVTIEAAADCWVRQVDSYALAGATVVMQPTSQRITVQDCRSLEPVSEDAGHRRCAYYVMGQQCLVQRCLALEARHAFVTGYCAAGPNAFVQCEARQATSYCGGLDSWACGTLYDIVEVDGHDIVLKNLGQDNNGAGWNAAGSTCWQCSAAEIHCYAPDEANRNRAYGSWAQFSGNGQWVSSNSHVQPRSLYCAQLQARLSAAAGDAWTPTDSLRVARQCRVLQRSTDASSSPTVEKAQLMAALARTEPRLTLDAWIMAEPDLPSERPLSVNRGRRQAVRTFAAASAAPAVGRAALPVMVQNGHLTYDDQVLIGGHYQTPWWNGKLRPSYLDNPVMTRPALTRHVPDREGLGLTDRIDSVVAYVQQHDIVAWDQNYGLWYDRRRDDHERVRRRDATVWAPFWEQPWANTGEGAAWNGLSLYDLTQPNTWYYGRLKEFATKVAPMGKMLYLEHYFQHNILEAGAHWVDSPWRPTNNVNGTVFPEPVPFTGDKRVFVAEWFYDEQNVTMRDLHRQYIRRNLDEFADNPNVVHYISEEYTGPLHFTRFWVETIRQWQQETGRDVLVALAATKDVQDSILADPVLSQVIDIIDIRYWHYKSKPDAGSRKTWDDGRDVFDPAGGVNLAPRQHARQQPVGKVRFEDAYRAVNEYRQRYPGKAVVYYAQNYPEMAWAVLMAGGSAAGVKIADAGLRRQLVDMQPVGAADRQDAKVLASNEGVLVYGLSACSVNLPELAAGRYAVREIERNTGELKSDRPRMITVGGKDCQDPVIAIEPQRIYWITGL